MKLTITRALTEIKTLEKRFDDGIRELNPLAVIVGTTLCRPYSMYKPEDFEKQAKAKLQSIEDIHKRIILIKNLIDKSNSETKVIIGGSEMTVTEALALKSRVGLKLQLIAKLKCEYNSVNSEYARQMETMDARKENLLKSCTDDKSRESMQKTLDESPQFKVDFVDPLDIKNLVEKLQSESDTITTELDYVLSESNAITCIEVPD